MCDDLGCLSDEQTSAFLMTNALTWLGFKQLSLSVIGNSTSDVTVCRFELIAIDGWMAVRIGSNGKKS